MIRLNSIYIKGFKDPEAEKYLEFSPEPISVIYGENGSGKTTLLKILFAVLDRDEYVLRNEKVQKVNVKYQIDNEAKELRIIKNGEGEFSWTTDVELCNKTGSILFGLHRGIKDKDINLNGFLETITDWGYRFTREINELSDIDYDRKYHNLRTIYDEFKRIRNYYIEKQNSNSLKEVSHIPHLYADSIPINDIGGVIEEQFIEGQNIISERIKSSLFETIEKAVDIEENQENFDLPSNFSERLQKHKSFIEKAIQSENTSLTERVKKYIETNDNALIEKSKIFRAMLLNIIEGAEEPNPTLESVTKLQQIFNEYLYKGKKLVVDITTKKLFDFHHRKSNIVNAYIRLKNNNIHELKDLSSGERNLLSILTLFLIIGQNRNFLIIDEPELSLNMKWQEKFLPLLHEINPNAQIIVASHSPSIAYESTKYLVELK